jgi:hypothetical protein
MALSILVGTALPASRRLSQAAFRLSCQRFRQSAERQVSRFVNASGTSGRSTRVAIVATIAATIVCVISGPFHTAALPWPTRSLFWLTLIGWNVVKWRSWTRLAPLRLPRGHAGVVAHVLGGAILLNLTLPLEINWLFMAVGVPVQVAWAGVFLAAAAISLLIGVIIALIAAPAPPLSDAAATTAVAAPPAPAPASGLAARVAIADLHAIVAEDHYLRLHLADGRQPLVLYRFGDALQELAGHPGLQVHRSAWVADAAQPRALREGRKWRLQLASGVIVPVSQTFVPALRARGLLQRVA